MSRVPHPPSTDTVNSGAMKLSALTDDELGAVFNKIPESSRCIVRSVCGRFAQLVNPDQKKIAVSAAVESVSLMEWARSAGCPLTAKTCTRAADAGKLEVLQWLRGQNPPCPWGAPYTLTRRAAKHGHLAILQWALENGCPWNERTCEAAAMGGQLHVLQWLRSQSPPCPWGERTCESAAFGGHLALLQWARANGCPWGGWTCAFAAKGGHLDVLKWLRDNGCPWDQMTCTWADWEGHLDVLQWARENGCPRVMRVD
jgi:hypothetical protein